MEIIEIVKHYLSQFPQLRYAFEDEYKLTIYSNTTSSNIHIQFWEREHTMFFERWHWHFDNNNRENFAMVETLGIILCNRAKVKVFKRFGKAYRWDMELPGDNHLKKKPLWLKLPRWLLLFQVPTIEYNTIYFL